MTAAAGAFCESSVGNLVKPMWMVFDLGRLTAAVLETAGTRFNSSQERFNYLESQCMSGRPPPLTPDAFATQLERKKLTSRNADLEKVQQLYRQAFTARLGTATELTYCLLEWGDQHLEEFANVLALADSLPRVEVIDLGRNQITDAGIRVFALAASEGGLPSLTTLYLHGNLITDAGLEALHQMLVAGGLSALREIFYSHHDGFMGSLS
eukprot:2136941-Prymnesium_polylepis.2